MNDLNDLVKLASSLQQKKIAKGTGLSKYLVSNFFKHKGLKTTHGDVLKIKQYVDNLIGIRIKDGD